MKRPEATRWEVLGNLTGGSQEELAEMRDLLEGRDPFEVMDQVTDPLVLDVPN
jgi:hypothetical protein